MTEKAFRLDFFIAIAALLVSALTAATLVYQTHVISDQYAATIWPYITVSSTYSPRGESLAITNDGLGPALIESAQLSASGTPLANWNDYFNVLLKDPPIRAFFTQTRDAAAKGSVNGSITTGSLGPSTTIRPGESDQLFKIDLPNAPVDSILKHPVTVDICYCSLNNSCWILHAEQSQTAVPKTQQVSRCTSSAAIGAPHVTSPSVRPRKK